MHVSIQLTILYCLCNFRLRALFLCISIRRLSVFPLRLRGSFAGLTGLFPEFLGLLSSIFSSSLSSCCTVSFIRYINDLPATCHASYKTDTPSQALSKAAPSSMSYWYPSQPISVLSELPRTFCIYPEICPARGCLSRQISPSPY